MEFEEERATKVKKPRGIMVMQLTRYPNVKTYGSSTPCASWAKGSVCIDALRSTRKPTFGYTCT